MKNLRWLLVGGFIIIVFLLVFLLPEKAHDSILEEKTSFCTLEARQCGDGTFVGREGEGCEYAPCLGEEPTSFDEPIVSDSGNIKVYSPVKNQRISKPVIILGEGRLFEGNVNYRLLNEEDVFLANGFTTVNSPEVGTFGPFSISLEYSAQEEGARGFVEVFSRSAKDGSIIDLVRIPVILSTEEASVAKVYFANSLADPDGMNCIRTYPVERAVRRVDDELRLAMDVMLAGPTKLERELGFFSNFDNMEDIEVNSLELEGDLAKVDFSAGLNYNMAGSCKVESARSQIANTLRQFKEVNEVLISVDGDEEVLQP